VPNRNFAHFSPEGLHNVEEDFEWEHFSLFAFLVEVGLLPNVPYNCQFAKFITSTCMNPIELISLERKLCQDSSFIFGNL
jgi:hypothetical protein